MHGSSLRTFAIDHGKMPAGISMSHAFQLKKKHFKLRSLPLMLSMFSGLIHVE